MINELYNNLRGECKDCFGLCCRALYFSKCDGFPEDKLPGTNCKNLKEDYKCKVHNDLISKGLKGCTSYDCFGAGQKVACVTYKGKEDESKKQEIFDVFLVMVQLHEMLWYLTEAYRMHDNAKMQEAIMNMINETDKLTRLEGSKLLKLDLVPHRMKVNQLLKATSESMRNKFRDKRNKGGLKSKKKIAGRLNLMGQSLKNMNLSGEDLSGAFLIGADLRNSDFSGCDLIGADLRDADVRGADFSNSIFLTQIQINAAKGDSQTKLPESIVRPHTWSK